MYHSITFILYSILGAMILCFVSVIPSCDIVIIPAPCIIVSSLCPIQIIAVLILWFVMNIHAFGCNNCFQETTCKRFLLNSQCLASSCRNIISFMHVELIFISLITVGDRRYHVPSPNFFVIQCSYVDRKILVVIIIYCQYFLFFMFKVQYMSLSILAALPLFSLVRTPFFLVWESARLLLFHPLCTSLLSILWDVLKSVLSLAV